MNARVGQWLYGMLFCVLLPLGLVGWAWGLDRTATRFWPLPLSRAAGGVLLVAGMALMGGAMWRLRRQGGGLPMNAYPTLRWVTQGVYAWLPHPIYTGFVLTVVAVAALSASSGGFWVVAPACALGALSLVWGYEKPATERRLGTPAEPAAQLALLGRVQLIWLPLVMWAALYAMFARLPAPAGAVDLRAQWELGLPLPEWAVWVYSLAYVFSVVAPLCVAERALLLRYRRAAWCVLAGGFGTMLLWPGQITMLQGDLSPLGAELLALNRAVDADWLACPSFHAAWAILAACVLGRGWPAWRPAAWALALMICVSCVLTGSHATVDVVAGMLLGGLGWQAASVWRVALHAAERLANSWSCRRWRSVRIISHWLWSALGAAVGLVVVIWFAGADSAGWATLVVVAGLLAAGAWGGWLEGGNRLARPFGYYGFLFGSLAALALVLAVDAPLGGRLAAAFATAAPLAQAIGRLRCLVQGCCHGRPVAMAHNGMRVWQPMSRVVALARLANVPIHATQLYSIGGNLVIAAILWRLWALQVSWTLIGGLYLLLSSMLRFVEEQYRGEPQTPSRHGLAVYQWLALAMALAGMALSMLDGPQLAAAHTVPALGVALAVGMGLLAALLMSVDWPDSRRRFSRLTVLDERESGQ